MSGLEAPLIIAGVSSAVSTYSSIKSGFDQAKAKEREAALMNLQADELLARQLINEKIMREESERRQLQFGSAFAATGAGGGGVGAILKMKEDLESNIELTRRDANFKADMIRRGADINLQLASDIRVGSIISGVSSGINSGVGIWEMDQKYGKPNAAKGLG